MGEQVEDIYRFGPFQLDVAERLLLHDGDPLSLTPKAFETLVVLVQNSNRLVGKNELLEKVWPDTFVEETTLAQNIFTLRKVLGQRDKTHQYIVTIPRRGYRFVAPAEEMSDQLASSPTEKQTRARSSTAEPETQSAGHKIITSLAVLPLTNMSAEQEAEYLSDGITESITNNLSRIPKLRIMSRSTTSRYKGKEVDPQEAGRNLNVQAVLVGRVLQLGNRLVIRVELVEVAHGWQLWGEEYNCEVSDILTVQKEIAKQISEKLKLRLTVAEQKQMTKSHTKNIEAYQFYLQGHYSWHKQTVEGCERAIESFKRAIEIDPGYALAYSGIADAYILLDLYCLLPPRETMPKAKAAALRAVEIDDRLAEAHISLGCVKMIYDWDWAGAEREFKRALELNPSCAHAHSWYSLLLLAMGQSKEALAESKQALELAPLDLSINHRLGWYYLYNSQYDQAIKQLQKTLKINGDFYLARLLLGKAYEQNGDFDKALAEFRNIKILDCPLVLGFLGYIYAVSGNRDKALKALKELKGISENLYIPSYSFGLIHAGLDQNDQALEEFEEAVDARNEWMTWIKFNPGLESLRADSRFIGLLRRMGLAD